MADDAAGLAVGAQLDDVDAIDRVLVVVPLDPVAGGVLDAKTDQEAVTLLLRPVFQLQTQGLAIQGREGVIERHDLDQLLTAVP